MVTFDGDPDMYNNIRLEVKKKIYEHKDLTEIKDIMKKINEGEEFRTLLQNHLMQVYIIYIRVPCKKLENIDLKLEKNMHLELIKILYEYIYIIKSKCFKFLAIITIKI